MITYATNRKTYTGETIDQVVREVLVDNTKNNKLYNHNPYPVDYNEVYNMVKTKDRRLRRANGYKEASENSSQRRRENQIARNQPISFGDAVRGAKAIVKMAKGQVVDGSEILRRANICTGCHLSSKSSGCATCRFGRQVTDVVNVIRSLAGRSISYPNIKGSKARDMNCGACGCSLMVMLPAQIECFDESEEKNQSRPDICWAKRGSVNYIPTDNNQV